MSAGVAIPQGATYEDVLRAPEHTVAELIDGALFLERRGSPARAWATSAITAALVDRREDWHTLFRPELHLGQATGAEDPRAMVLVPDVAAWRVERLPRLPRSAGISLAPDLVCDVVLDDSTWVRVQKLAAYARAGVRCVWLVQPDWRMIEVYRLHEEKWLWSFAAIEPGMARLEPFEAAEIDTDRWWPEEEPA